MRFLLLLLLFASLSAEEFSVNISAPTNTLQVGEEFTVNFTATHPAGYKVDTNELKKGLLEYFGYGIAPFSLAKEESPNLTPTKTEVRFKLVPTITGDFDLTFGPVAFNHEGESILRLSPIIPLKVVLGSIDTDYLPPPPQFLLIDPLLPVEIDMEMKQKLMLEREDKLWENLFFMRKIPLYALPLIVFLVIGFIAYQALRRTKKEVPKARDINAILRALLNEIKTIQTLQKEGKIPPEEALVKMQKALVDCLELRLNLPASAMTVEEVKDALIKIPALQGSSFENIDSLLTLTLGIKFGKKTVEKQEAIDLMDRSVNALEGLVL